METSLAPSHDNEKSNTVDLGEQPLTAAGLGYDHVVRRDRPGWMYLIQFGSTSFHKVGYTKNAPEARLTTLQVGSPIRLALVAAGWHDRVRASESTAHRVLKGRLVGGEWYELDQTHLAWAIDLVTNGEPF